MLFSRDVADAELVHSREEVTIARSPETVMAFVLAPESVLLVGTMTERCFRAPDTPARAVGEQHVSFAREGDLVTLQVDEVVELDFPHRAVVVNRTTPGDITVTYTCTPLGDDATTYVQEVRMSPEPGTAAIMQSVFDAETVRSVRRIKEALENDEWTPPADGD